MCSKNPDCGEVDEKTVNKLLQGLGVESNELLAPEQKEKLKKLVFKYQDVFSEPGKEIGKTELITFDVELKDEHVQPTSAKVRPLNLKQLESLRKQL